MNGAKYFLREHFKTILTDLKIHQIGMEYNPISGTYE